MNIQKEELHGQGVWGGETEHPCHHQRCHSPSTSKCSPNWKLSEPFLGVSPEALLHRHDWLKHWPLGLTQPPGSRQEGTEISYPLILWTVLQATSPHPGLLPKNSSHWPKKRHLYHSPHRKLQGLRSCEPGKRTDKYQIYVRNIFWLSEWPNQYFF